MKNHLLQVEKGLTRIKTEFKENVDFGKDIDLELDFILPYSNAESISNVKLVIIGQDPTIQDEKEISKKRQKEITITLDLNNENGNLRRYCKLICQKIGFNIDKEVYATNLCKCVFKEKPAYNGVLDKHSRYWIPFLKKELSVFSDNVIFITLGQPLIIQLIHSNKKEVKHYWDYIGNTSSNYNFKCCEPMENYLHKRIYPLAHQPTWSLNEFYKKYLNDYLKFIKENEQKR
jgi:uracil-DNA glycosylase